MKSGFSLVEVMITVAILGILFAGIGTVPARLSDKAQHEVFQSDAAMIAHAVVIYRECFGVPPDDIENLWEEGILLGENLSPWKTPYRIRIDDKGLRKIEAARGAGKDNAEMVF